MSHAHLLVNEPDPHADMARRAIAAYALVDRVTDPEVMPPRVLPRAVRDGITNLTQVMGDLERIANGEPVDVETWQVRDRAFEQGMLTALIAPVCDEQATSGTQMSPEPSAALRAVVMCAVDCAGQDREAWGRLQFVAGVLVGAHVAKSGDDLDEFDAHAVVAAAADAIDEDDASTERHRAAQIHTPRVERPLPVGAGALPRQVEVCLAGGRAGGRERIPSV